MAKDEELIELSFPQYWDERYKIEQNGQEELESYEWFRSFQKLKSFFDQHLPSTPLGSDCHILHLGCGNSVPAPLFPFILASACSSAAAAAKSEKPQLTSVCRP